MAWVIAKRWEVGRKIGGGGQGQVYLAWDRQEQRWAAVKTYDYAPEREPVARQRFRQEAERAQALGAASKYVVEVLGFGEDDGRGHAYLVMELAERGSIEQRRRTLRKQGLDLPRRLIHRALGQLGDALDAARRLHLTHRDIKLGNLLLDDDDDLLLADFGSAQHELDPTMTEGVMGTAAYLAPERWLNQRATHAADIYAAAVVAYILLCHRAPFEGSVNEVMLSALNDEAPAPTSVRSGLPAEVDTILLRGLAKKPEDRWPTAKEMFSRLQEALADWATSDTEAQPVVQAAAEETQVLNARERAMASNPLTRTFLAPTMVARAMAERVAGEQEGRTEVILLSGGIAAIMLSLLFVVIVAQLWATLTGPVGAVSDLVASAANTGWRQWQLFSRGRSTADWLWMAPAALILAVVARRKRRLEAGIAATLVVTVIALVFVLGSPRSNGDLKGTSIPTKKEMRQNRQRLLAAIRREASRWESHYKLHPNASAQQNTRSNFGWAKKLVANATRSPRGVRQMQLAHNWLVRWHRQRRAMLHSGAW